MAEGGGAKAVKRSLDNRERSRAMSEFDRSGPLGAGPRTGRNRGGCNRAVARATAVADPYHDCGLGWGHWPENGGRGRRFGRGRRAATDSVRPDVALDQRRAAFLERRIEALTEELERAKALLSGYPRDDAQDGE